MALLFMLDQLLIPFETEECFMCIWKNTRGTAVMDFRDRRRLVTVAVKYPRLTTSLNTGWHLVAMVIKYWDVRRRRSGIFLTSPLRYHWQKIKNTYPLPEHASSRSTMMPVAGRSVFAYALYRWNTSREKQGNSGSHFIYCWCSWCDYTYDGTQPVRMWVCEGRRSRAKEWENGLVIEMFHS